MYGYKKVVQIMDEEAKQVAEKKKISTPSRKPTYLSTPERKIGGHNVYRANNPPSQKPLAREDVSPEIEAEDEDDFCDDEVLESQKKYEDLALQLKELESKRATSQNAILGEFCDPCYENHTSLPSISRMLDEPQELASAFVLSEILRKPKAFDDETYR